jgi:hypothetical protein
VVSRALSDGYFQVLHLTYSDCRYKNGKKHGKVWGPWPGSSLHYLEIMSTPRWEDYEIRYLNKNRFTYFGNGRTQRELEGRDLAHYLTKPDLRAVREKVW